MSLQVSITGEPGCGKTTVAKIVAQLLGAQYTSTGSIQRDIAASMGISTLELNQRAESDPTIDQQIDANTIALGQSGKMVVVDSRLAWRFLPASLKVFLVCPPEVAATRVFDQNRANETYASKDEAIAKLIARHDSEKLRFAKYYGAQLSNLRNYDVVIDTSLAKPEVIAAAIAETAKQRATLQLAPLLLLSPQTLKPNQSLINSEKPTVDGLIHCCKLGAHWSIVAGHAQVKAALAAGQTFLAARLAGQDDEVIRAGVTARSLSQTSVAANDPAVGQ
jgi:CMP/dCMP kinase